LLERERVIAGAMRVRLVPAEQVFALGAFTATLTYIVAFSITKALTNLDAVSISDRYGRKPVLNP